MTTVFTPKSLRIRRAVPDDAPAISALILSLAHHCLLESDGAGAEDFLQSLNPEGIARNLSNTELDYYVGTAGNQLVGVVAVRHRTHLFHLFVGQEFQRMGVAKLLWSYVEEVYKWRSSSALTTVNATLFAVPFYESVGFRASGPQVQTNGVAFIPMQLVKI